MKNLTRIDRRTVRARFEERFTSGRMARAYVRHYEQLASAVQRPAVRAPRLDPAVLQTEVSSDPALLQAEAS